MIRGHHLSRVVFELFLNATNAYVAKLFELADAIRAEEPGTAELLETLGQFQAGQALDLVQQWPASVVATPGERDSADGLQRPA